MYARGVFTKPKTRVCMYLSKHAHGSGVIGIRRSQEYIAIYTHTHTHTPVQRRYSMWCCGNSLLEGSRGLGLNPFVECTVHASWADNQGTRRGFSTRSKLAVGGGRLRLARSKRNRENPRRIGANESQHCRAQEIDGTRWESCKNTVGRAIGRVQRRVPEIGPGGGFDLDRWRFLESGFAGDKNAKKAAGQTHDANRRAGLQKQTKNTHMPPRQAMPLKGGFCHEGTRQAEPHTDARA